MHLTKLQTQEVLKEFLNKENGLNQVLEMVLNSLMLIERSEFLSSDPCNKGKGYRLGSVFGYGHQIELKIPRDRLSNFTPCILALLRHQETYLKEVSFQLYSKGLTTRDISDVMELIYGKYYSKSSISNISQSFYEQMNAWRNRNLDSHYLVFYIDGLYTKLKRGNRYENESFYSIVGLREDFTREVVGIVNFPSESSIGWQQVFEDLQNRGVASVGWIVSDGVKGLEKAITHVFKTTPHQKCTLHLTRNLMAYVRREDRKQLADAIRELLSPERVDYTKQLAHQNLIKMATKWKVKYKTLGNYMENLEWEPYFTYLEYSIHIRRMIYTTNWIERFNKSCRRTLKIRGAFPNEESVLALITSTAIEKTTKHYAYPIYNFKFEEKLNRKSKNSSLIY